MNLLRSLPVCHWTPTFGKGLQNLCHGSVDSAGILSSSGVHRIPYLPWMTYPSRLNAPIMQKISQFPWGDWTQKIPPRIGASPGKNQGMRIEAGATTTPTREGAVRTALPRWIILEALTVTVRRPRWDKIIFWQIINSQHL
jgi:hypothetical protein